jgi:hypothetical protein
VRSLVPWWDRFWFDGGSAVQLALLRIVTAVVSLWVLLSRDPAATSGFPPVFWKYVDPATRWRYMEFPGHLELERILQYAATLALFGVLLGVAPRVCAFVASLLLYHFAPYEAILWTSSPYVRGYDTPVIALAALAASPCGDVWALLKPRRAGLREPWEYAWPGRIVQLLLVCMYFFPGYSKLLDVGWGWASAENMRALTLAFNQGSEATPFTAPGLWLAAHPALCEAMGIGTLAFELSFPFVLFSRRARWVYIPGALLLHILIYFMMNITVLYTIFFVVFIDRIPFGWGRPKRGMDGQKQDTAYPTLSGAVHLLTQLIGNDTLFCSEAE